MGKLFISEHKFTNVGYTLRKANPWGYNRRKRNDENLVINFVQIEDLEQRDSIRQHMENLGYNTDKSEYVAYVSMGNKIYFQMNMFCLREFAMDILNAIEDTHIQ